LPYLSSTDWLILLLYSLGSIGIGVAMRSTVKTSTDYFQAARTMRTGVCTIGLIMAGLGAPEVLGLGAAGAAFGFRPALYFVFGSIPALLIAARFFVPLYYNSGAATLPGYLGLRFDSKTRTLAASLFVLSSLASAAIAVFIVARVLQTLRVFDSLFFAYGWPREGIFLVCILLATVPVFIYVVIAGLRGTIISLAVQFVLLVAGFLPVVWIALRNSDGLTAIASLQTSLTPLSNSSPAILALTALAFGFVLGSSRWMTDFRVLQVALAAKTAGAARRSTALASTAWVAVPFVFVLAGSIAMSLPTPQSKTTVRNENGAIYHEITIVPREISEGRGMVPALIDPAGNPRRDNSGNVRLDYGMATPNLITHFVSTGLLGLAIAGLLAGLMSCVASAAIAASAVFTHDLFQPLNRTSADDSLLVRVGRSASAAAIIIPAAAAFVIAQVGGPTRTTVISTWLATSLTLFAILQAPQLATFVLGAFNRRTGGTAAFAGIIAGVITALLHFGLTVPADTVPGFQGGFIAVLHRYPDLATQTFFTVIFSFVANLAIALIASVFTPAPADDNIKSLVYSSAITKPPKKSARRQPR
jgi:solute:Na+ symporter, SSS family